MGKGVASREGKERPGKEGKKEKNTLCFCTGSCEERKDPGRRN